jgi:uncharacterized protein (DUF486 family)
MPTVALLLCSNVFMTLAWYGHLKWFHGHEKPMLFIILFSWGLAFFEYCFQVPANRIGYGQFSATQLKIIQEALSVTTFMIFAVLVLHESLKWNHFAAFALIAGAVYLAVAVK